MRFVVVASPGIASESDVACGQQADVEHSAIARFVENDADLAAASLAAFLEEDDIEGLAGNAVAMVGDAEGFEFHEHLLCFVGFALGDEFDPDSCNSAFVGEFGEDGIYPVAVAGRDDDPEAGVTRVVVELLASGTPVVFVQEVAEFAPVLANRTRGCFLCRM
jgi:hypothetical protein